MPWQQGLGGPVSTLAKQRPHFTVEKDGHDEAEAKCLACNRVYWSLSPQLVRDAKEA